MKISTRAHYGARLMLELGLHYGRGPLFLKDIARAQDISEKYLSQIIIPLRTAGLVDSFRGAKGGYVLARPPFGITLKEIVGVLEGGFDLGANHKNRSDIQKPSENLMNGIWKSLGNTIAQALDEITIDTLLKMYRQKKEENIMYSI